MGQTASDGVKVICNDVVQKGDSVYIDAVVTVSSDAVKSRSYLELTPVLESASQKEGLPSILVNGRIRQKVYNREVALDNLNDVPHYTILKAGKEDQVVSYKTAVPFEDWMKDARVVLDPNLCGCGKEEAGSPLLIADKIRRRPDKRYEVQPTFSYITPMAETEKHRAEVGTAFLDFQVGKYQILPDFRNNAVELAKINNTIRTVTEDKNVKPTGIVLKGYASPEGSYASNKKLADNRVKALRDYIRQKNDFKADFFTMSSEPEDWVGFKEKVEADPNVPNRSEVLAIIDSSDDPDRKEAKLRALGGGAAFRYVLKDIFPSLRRSEYKIDYTVREFTVDEGREIIKTRPQQLSLGEMFAVANSYEIGSDTFIENVDIILVDGLSTFGNGVEVAVLNETGGREVLMNDKLSAHQAYILALYRHRPELINRMKSIADYYSNKHASAIGSIGNHVMILNTGSIKNVRIGDYCHICGTCRLSNGSVNSNVTAPVHIGHGVICDDFIISSGSKVDDGTMLTRCFVGQSCKLGHNYSASDSLFFSNCQGENGEACAIFAGPFTCLLYTSPSPRDCS